MGICNLNEVKVGGISKEFTLKAKNNENNDNLINIEPSTILYYKNSIVKKRLRVIILTITPVASKQPLLKGIMSNSFEIYFETQTSIG